MPTQYQNYARNYFYISSTVYVFELSTREIKLILSHSGLHLRSAGAGTWRPLHDEAGGEGVELAPEDLHEALPETRDQTQSILLGCHIHRRL